MEAMSRRIGCSTRSALVAASSQTPSEKPGASSDGGICALFASTHFWSAEMSHLTTRGKAVAGLDHLQVHGSTTDGGSHALIAGENFHPHRRSILLTQKTSENSAFIRIFHVKRQIPWLLQVRANELEISRKREI